MPHANASAQSVTKSRSGVRPLRSAVSRKQLRGRDSWIARERLNKTRVSAYEHDSATGPHNSSGLGCSAAPVIDIGLDECCECRLERSVCKRQAGDIALNQTLDASTSPGNCELVCRDIQADN